MRAQNKEQNQMSERIMLIRHKEEQQWGVFEGGARSSLLFYSFLFRAAHFKLDPLGWRRGARWRKPGEREAEIE